MNIRKLSFAFVAAVAIGGHCLPAQAALPAAVSGSWFNPAQSGHGLTVEVIDPEQALIFWHTYDADGAPLTLYIEGVVNGRRIDGAAYAPRGMRFGEFDPQRLQLPPWGEVDIEFVDCQHARLSWSPVLPGFAAGSMDLVRLVGIDGQSCDLPAPITLQPGLYQGEFQPGRSGAPAGNGIGVVDGEGRLWAMERVVDASGLSTLPGSGWDHWFGSGNDRTYLRSPLVVMGTPVDASSDAMRVFSTCNSVLTDSHYNDCGGGPQQGQWSAAAVNVPATAEGTDDRAQRWLPASGDEVLVEGLSMEQLAGDYEVAFDARFDPEPGRLEVDAEGGLCLRTGRTGECDYQGRLYLPDGSDGLIDFELDRRGDALVRGVRGRGWLTEGPSGRSLYLVGNGLGLVAR